MDEFYNPRNAHVPATDLEPNYMNIRDVYHKKASCSYVTPKIIQEVIGGDLRMVLRFARKDSEMLSAAAQGINQ